MNNCYRQAESCGGSRSGLVTGRGMTLLLVLALAGCGGGGGGGGVDGDWETYDTTFDAVATADLNGDGAPDLIFSRTTDQFKITKCDPSDCNTKERSLYNVVILLQDALAPGVFLAQPAYALAGKALSVVIADIDGDGLIDFCVTQRDDGSVGVFLQNPGLPGAFLTRVDVPAVDAPAGLSGGDLNGDAVADLAVAGSGLALLVNDPLSPGTVFTLQDLGITDATAVANADIDGDGRNDLAVTTGDTVIVLLQDHAPAVAGGFAERASYTTGSEASDVAIGDLNGDTLPDLAVANRGSPVGSVAVLLQNPGATGTFLPAANHDTDQNSVDVDIGDLNADLFPDLAVANDANPGGVSVLLQDGLTAGAFLAAVDYPGQRGPNAVAIADMNGDGFTDLVVADKIHGWPYIRYQDASNPGSFLEPVVVQ